MDCTRIERGVFWVEQMGEMAGAWEGQGGRRGSGGAGMARRGNCEMSREERCLNSTKDERRQRSHERSSSRRWG